MESPAPPSQSVQVEARPPPPAPPGFARRPAPTAAEGEEEGWEDAAAARVIAPTTARGGRCGAQPEQTSLEQRNNCIGIKLENPFF
jgi:hypothetical protein